MGITQTVRNAGCVLAAVVLLSFFVAGCGSGTLAKANNNPGGSTPTPTPGTSPSPTPTPAPSPSPTPGPGPSPSPSPTPASGVPHSSHVVLIVDENTGYNNATANMSWLVNEGNTYAHANNYVSNTTGSLMDYLWLASGSCEASANCALPSGTNNFNCTGNDCTGPITDDSIWSEMDRLGISWKVYAQSYAAAGGKVTTPDNANGTSYYRRHNGATWYAEILNNVNGAQSKIVDFSVFAQDLAQGTLPQFSWIVPDGLHDAHDASPAQADAFLQTNIAPLLNQPDFQAGGDGLLIVTFDNGDNDIAGTVYFAMMGPNVKQGYVSTTSYHHENTLRTMLDALGIATHPGASATANPMVEFFK